MVFLVFSWPPLRLRGGVGRRRSLISLPSGRLAACPNQRSLLCTSGAAAPRMARILRVECSGGPLPKFSYWPLTVPVIYMYMISPPTSVICMWSAFISRYRLFLWKVPTLRLSRMTASGTQFSNNVTWRRAGSNIYENWIFSRRSLDFQSSLWICDLGVPLNTAFTFSLHFLKVIKKSLCRIVLCNCAAVSSINGGNKFTKNW